MIENGGTMRRSRSYRSYKFTDKHHSKGGIRSSIAGAIALVCTIVDLQFAFAHKGNAGNITIGVISIVTGIVCGILLIVSGAGLLKRRSDIMF